MKKFWLVWNPAKPRTERKHDSFAAADAEARRLATNELGTFVVLEAVGCVNSTAQVVVQEESLDA